MWGRTEHENQHFRHLQGATSATYWTKSCAQVVVMICEHLKSGILILQLGVLKVLVVIINIGLLWKQRWWLSKVKCTINSNGKEGECNHPTIFQISTYLATFDLTVLVVLSIQISLFSLSHASNSSLSFVQYTELTLPGMVILTGTLSVYVISAYKLFSML